MPHGRRLSVCHSVMIQHCYTSPQAGVITGSVIRGDTETLSLHDYGHVLPCCDIANYTFLLATSTVVLTI